MLTSLRRLPVLGGAALLAGALGAGSMVGTASAHVSVCRTDPVFFLSNGYKLTIYAIINSQAQQVRNVNYVVHIPQGTHVVRTVLTGGQFTHKETVQATADDSTGQYNTDTLVTTSTPTVGVTATTILLNQVTDGNPVSGSASGSNGQHLLVQLNS
jgi:hypothetical protein